MMCSLIATISPFRRSISAQSRAFSSSAVAIWSPPVPTGFAPFGREATVHHGRRGEQARPVGSEAPRGLRNEPRVGYTRSCGDTPQREETHGTAQVPGARGNRRQSGGPCRRRGRDRLPLAARQHGARSRRAAHPRADRRDSGRVGSAPRGRPGRGSPRGAAPPPALAGRGRRGHRRAARRRESSRGPEGSARGRSSSAPGAWAPSGASSSEA